MALGSLIRSVNTMCDRYLYFFGSLRFIYLPYNYHMIFSLFLPYLHGIANRFPINYTLFHYSRSNTFNHEFCKQVIEKTS